MEELIYKNNEEWEGYSINENDFFIEKFIYKDGKISYSPERKLK